MSIGQTLLPSPFLEKIMKKSLVPVFLAVLFLGVSASLSVADEIVDDQAVVACDAQCCPAPGQKVRFGRFARFMPQDCEIGVREFPCVVPVCKVGPLGLARTVYVPCECGPDDCAGRAKVVRVGKRLMRAKICDCACEFPMAAE